ncbi:hypothetical protein F5887DRAFT_944519 [Amanita rubescens]|nr:hypothetical protein F5887DRAFT_944519 [Amanita rubescens]
MLKRQRPTTPPIPSMPLWADPSPLDSMMMEREHKRRRTTSITPLDTPWKDWGNKLQAIANDADNSPEPTDSEYRTANGTLRELHTLHQHRLLFSSHNSPFQSALEQSKRIPLEAPNIDEQTQVKERYEETNRILGSMLLSRRRELGLDESCPH